MSDNDKKDKQNKSQTPPSHAVVADMGLWHRLKSQFIPEKEAAPVVTESFEDMLNEGRAKAAKPRKIKQDSQGIVIESAQKQRSAENLAIDSGMDGRTQRRLKQGKLPIEGVLDLHGMTQAQAQAAVSGFIEKSYGLNQRCVLIITGKGRFSKDEIGVLRRALPDWLNMPPLNEKILSFTKAHKKDGGEGAYYIYLRK